MGYDIIPENVPCGKIEKANNRASSVVVINEQHTMMDAQCDLLWESGISFDMWKVPADGIGWHEQFDMCNWLMSNYDKVVFLSPIPGMIKEVARRDSDRCVLLMNDARIKKELPNGKVIMVVAPTGWYLG